MRDISHIKLLYYYMFLYILYYLMHIKRYSDDYICIYFAIEGCYPKYDIVQLLNCVLVIYKKYKCCVY